MKKMSAGNAKKPVAKMDAKPKDQFDKTAYEKRSIKAVKELLDLPMIADQMAEIIKESKNYMFTVAMSYRGIKAYVIDDHMMIKFNHGDSRDENSNDDRAMITCSKFEAGKKFADNKNFVFSDEGTFGPSGKRIAKHPDHFEIVAKGLEVLAHGTRHDLVDTGFVAFPEYPTNRILHHEHALKS